VIVADYFYDFFFYQTEVSIKHYKVSFCITHSARDLIYDIH